MSIESKDLMIGNYVLLPSGKSGLVNFISESDIGVKIDVESYRVGWELLSPILLTRELLIKCGFDDEVWQNKKLSEKEEGTINYLTINSGILFFVQKNDQGASFFEIKEILKDQTEEECNNVAFVQNEQSVILTEVKYLHQLQNVTYILTGEHLNITL